jgi:predicted nucleotidyltransferase
VLVWPSLPEVDRAVRDWAARQAAAHPALLAIGYFGSYARRESGPGSDLDLVVIVAGSDRAFIERAVEWDSSGLPVPTDLVVYTSAEWRSLQSEGGRFARVLAAETIWVLGAP